MAADSKFAFNFTGLLPYSMVLLSKQSIGTTFEEVVLVKLNFFLFIPKRLDVFDFEIRFSSNDCSFKFIFFNLFLVGNDESAEEDDNALAESDIWGDTIPLTIALIAFGVHISLLNLKNSIQIHIYVSIPIKG